jgi:hypothetical protein
MRVVVAGSRGKKEIGWERSEMRISWNPSQNHCMVSLSDGSKDVNYRLQGYRLTGNEEQAAWLIIPSLGVEVMGLAQECRVLGRGTTSHRVRGLWRFESWGDGKIKGVDMANGRSVLNSLALYRSKIFHRDKRQRGSGSDDIRRARRFGPHTSSLLSSGGNLQGAYVSQDKGTKRRVATMFTEGEGLVIVYPVA